MVDNSHYVQGKVFDGGWKKSPNNLQYSKTNIVKNIYQHCILYTINSKNKTKK